jgi:hypothetical protein
MEVTFSMDLAISIGLSGKQIGAMALLVRTLSMTPAGVLVIQ